MEIVVPELGESIVEATVARWLKKEGEQVSVGEAVVALETDKVDLEVGAKGEGVLVRIDHQEGEDVRVGEVLGIIEANAGEGGGPASDIEATPEASQVMKGPPEEPLGQEAGQTSGQPEGQPEPPGGGDGGAAGRATPVARRMAQEHGVDLAAIPGGRSGDRVTKEDIQRFLEKPQASPSAGERPQPAVVQAPDRRSAPLDSTPSAAPPLVLKDQREERLRMSRRRRTIASRLVEAQQTAAMLTTFNDVDMSAVIDIRKRHRESFQQKHGIKLGFMSFFVKAAVGALKEFPLLNAEIQGDEIVVKHYYDIGMAIGAEEGLVVPVLRDADRMTFAEIEKVIERFVQQTKEGKLSLEDLRGGTFTLTNGGVFGSLLSTPILNPPQVGILGLHRIEERPVAVAGQAVIRPMMYLALSYDHRIVDGSEAVRFLVRVKEMIQDPETLLLEG